MTWDVFGTASRELAQMVVDSGYEPDDRMPFERYIVGRQGRQPGIEVVDIGMPVRPLRRYRDQVLAKSPAGLAATHEALCFRLVEELKNRPADFPLNKVDVARISLLRADASPELLALGEQTLEHWVLAKGKEPTRDEREGFRLLALHRQGADKNPSFNACRETAREVAYHYNLVTMQPGHSDITNRLQLMGLVSKHLYLFIAGKLQVAGLGEFCCSSKPIRTTQDYETTTPKEA